MTHETINFDEFEGSEILTADEMTSLILQVADIVGVNGRKFVMGTITGH